MFRQDTLIGAVSCLHGCRKVAKGSKRWLQLLQYTPESRKWSEDLGYSEWRILAKAMWGEEGNSVERYPPLNKALVGMLSDK